MSYHTIVKNHLLSIKSNYYVVIVIIIKKTHDHPEFYLIFFNCLKFTYY